LTELTVYLVPASRLSAEKTYETWIAKHPDVGHELKLEWRIKGDRSPPFNPEIFFEIFHWQVFFIYLPILFNRLPGIDLLELPTPMSLSN
jgi:hypothetical protein